MREVKAQLESWPAWLEAKTVVLAVSGGVDSMVMLRLMNELNQLLETLPDSIQEEIKERLKDYICWMKREEPLQ